MPTPSEIVCVVEGDTEAITYTTRALPVPCLLGRGLSFLIVESSPGGDLVAIFLTETAKADTTTFVPEEPSRVRSAREPIGGTEAVRRVIPVPDNVREVVTNEEFDVVCNPENRGLRGTV